MKTRNTIATVLAGAGLAGGIAFSVPALAETTPTPNPTSSTSGSADAAADQGPAQRFAAALKGLVSSGTLTQAQSDKVAAALKPADGEGPGGHGGPGGRHGHGPGGGMGMRGGEAVQAAAAKALGLTAEQLRTELQTKSLGQIADEKKVSRATLTAALKSAMTSEFTDGLDERITRMLDAKAGDRPARPGQESNEQGGQTSPAPAPTTSGSST
ncbi:hypothetical protein [Agilicoccus flavus]|uniref:hypothetical protein n=1 Tax=Agilicoccus flavus TaxID=2775968 RepID=UPI001CF70408|nr:hypothetical protein [Agilicoccus flavus]